MTLEEQAQNVRTKARQIFKVLAEINQLCNLILLRYEFDGDVAEFPAEAKQKIIAKYQAKKTELEALVAELP